MGGKHSRLQRYLQKEEGELEGGKEGLRGRVEEAHQESGGFHPGLWPKGKQVYLDSRQGTVGWPAGQARACQRGGCGEGPALTMVGGSRPVLLRHSRGLKRKTQVMREGARGGAL